MLDRRDYRILIVEDESLLRLSLVRALRREGYRVTGVESGEEGLAQVGGGRVDLLILDINLPGMTGLEMLETLRAQGHEWPAIVITAFEDAGVTASCQKLGVFERIGKPFKLKDLKATVENALASAVHPGR